MKVRTSVKKRSPECIVVRRKGVVYVINKKESKIQTKTGLILLRENNSNKKQ